MRTDEPTCVAIVRFSAAGDVLLTAQAVRAVAEAWPRARRVFVTHARLAPLVAHHPDVDAVVGLQPGGSVWALARQLRRQWGVDAVLDLHGSLRSRLLVALLRPRRRARWRKRTLGEWAAVRLLGRPYRPRQTMAARLHAAAERLVGRALPLPAFRLALPVPPDRAGAPGAAPASRPRVGLSPGAGWASKRWPPAFYAAVARQLLAHGVEVLLFGDAREQPLTAAVAASAPGCVDLAGKLDWSETAAALVGLDAFVAGDTGPLHLARGLGVFVVALFTSTPAAQFDLRGHVALQAALACSPCSFYGRPDCPQGHAACLRAIGPDEVLQALAPRLGVTFGPAGGA